MCLNSFELGKLHYHYWHNNCEIFSHLTFASYFHISRRLSVTFIMVKGERVEWLMMRLLWWQTTVMDACSEDVEMMCSVLKCLSNWLDAYFIPLPFLITSALLVVPFSALVGSLIFIQKQIRSQCSSDGIADTVVRARWTSMGNAVFTRDSML